MVSIASLLGARHLLEVLENKPASSLVVSLGKALNGTPTFMWKTGDPEMATPKRVQTNRPKHSDTSLSREWRINMANKKKNSIDEGRNAHVGLLSPSFTAEVLFITTKL